VIGNLKRSQITAFETSGATISGGKIGLTELVCLQNMFDFTCGRAGFLGKLHQNLTQLLDLKK
jgi:hypothetical protein